MIYNDIADIVTHAKVSEAWMGLDLGTKTIGVAVSDRLLSSATPLLTLQRKNMDGSEGPRCQSTRAFARNLTSLTDLAIGFWDERLSTVAAERILLEADTTRKRRAKVIDQVAAGYILQGALDRAHHIRAKQ
jgi:putative Holliday junction resolvase